MTYTPAFPKPGKRRKAKPDETYRLLYRTLPCIIPGCKATPTAYCHFPHHRGIGGKNAGWAYNEGVPACNVHHGRMDNNGETWPLNTATRALVQDLAPAFWERIARQYEP